MSSLKLFLLLFLIGKLVMRLGLNLLNYLHLKHTAGQVPAALTGVVEPSKLQQIDAYNAAKMIFQMVYILWDNLILLLFLFTPAYPLYSSWIDSLTLPLFLRGLLFFGIIAAGSWLIGLPFACFFHFRIEEKFGFNRYTLWRWFGDELKNLLIDLIVLTIIFWIVLAYWGNDLSFQWGRVWGAWLIALGLIVLFMYLVPVLVIPFFYRLKPVTDEGLRQKIIHLVENCGLKVSKVVEADESQKSAHANAQMAGIGRTKTIILFDTLIANYNESEILAVLAHEIGHGKKRHLWIQIALAAVEFFLLIYFTARLLSSSATFTAWDTSQVIYNGVFIAFIIFGEIMSFFVTPFSSYLSRKLEYEADRFSKQVLQSGAPLRGVFLKFIVNELDNINPHPWYEAFYYSHPSLLKRIKALE
ncbi:MAG TPA: M48 family metallopeptidase [Bacillota bacterium]